MMLASFFRTTTVLPLVFHLTGLGTAASLGGTKL